jgi:hypothetical protein
MSHLVGGSVAHVKNSKSVVLRIAYAGEVAMLTGDATEATEDEILKIYKTKNRDMGELVTDVLKVAHHGSRRTSNRVAWIQAVNPWFLFVSSDRWGLLDEDEDPTGHRLPQQLTFDLYSRHAKRLTGSAQPHNYVASYQETDYTSYNNAPDVFGDRVNPRAGPKLLWLNNYDKLGIFTTLALAGQGKTDADRGVHYQAQIGDKGGIEVYATDIYSDPDPKLKPVDVASKK